MAIQWKDYFLQLTDYCTKYLLYKILFILNLCFGIDERLVSSKNPGKKTFLFVLQNSLRSSQPNIFDLAPRAALLTGSLGLLAVASD